MHQIAIDTANAQALAMIPESCGAVTVGCTDVAGVVEAVIASSKSLRSEHEALAETVRALEADQSKVAQASDEARLLSERAIERLNEGTSLIQSSLGQIAGLIELVDTLGQHVTSFSAAMEQVRRSAQDIDNIAETTNILALNATIEAMRAGDAGRTFAVVAAEVKSLASDTRKATEEIAATIDALGGEAEEVIGRIEAGAKASGEARASVARIESSLANVGNLVEEVDKQNDVIARSTGTISNHVDKVQRVLTSYDAAARSNEDRLHGAHRKMEDLEITASEMFDRIVHAGLSPEDSVMVAQAQAMMQELVAHTEAALARGAVTMSALFDTDYQPVPGTNPQLYRTRLTDWAHAEWRPFLDRAKASDMRVLAAACTDMNGFLPAHLTERSRTPTGDVNHDTQFCRNGRIMLEAIDRKAKVSTAPYMMAVYRQEGDGDSYVVVRNVYVPLVIGGRRWGDFELAYSFD
ncbi:methyl-accepting chemotaxis protein [Erythromicrobium ramosum]|uniref:Chemotaxis protein n=1 Tax=Erythrobacter ramosus TaxID=35811 RepID=A0A6I4UK61_9SPHN|nr:methyl-accepting chemotaxis protein [Erythrobacter ramosus]MBB3776066.1 methyl-accepting chemotaxis protein [Erythrobacter ramosus]MXP38846.1 chemotaxis protein [Erythrobacter ramosus]